MSTFNRRDFLKIAFVTTASLVSGCQSVIATLTPAISGTPTKWPTSTQSQTSTPTLTPTPLPSSSTEPTGIIQDLGSITHAIIHHSEGRLTYSKAELISRADQYENLHKTREKAEEYKTPGELEYSYIKYHWMIGSDGSVLQVQEHKYARIHSGNTVINLRSIAICLVGDFRSQKELDQAKVLSTENFPTDKQLKKAAQIIKEFNEDQGKKLVVMSHREVNLSGKDTQCPGDNVGNSDNPQSNLRKIARMAGE